MASDQDGKAAARRRFLKLASLGAVAGTVAAAAGTRQSEAAAAEPEQGGKGYRETEHVRWFYRRARM